MGGIYSQTLHYIFVIDERKTFHILFDFGLLIINYKIDWNI